MRSVVEDSIETTCSAGNPVLRTQPCECSNCVRRARLAQTVWSQTPLSSRLKFVSAARGLIADRANELGRSCGRPNLAESLAAEVLPLAEACRFLEAIATSTLKPTTAGRQGRPFWLRGVTIQVRREPLGVVLIVAPSNYPLMLPGIQTLQALIAGNAVLIKPAQNCSQPALAFRDTLLQSGLDEGLITILPEDVNSVESTIAAGVDKVVLTGSSSTGRAALRLLADRVVPAAMELAGCDAVFVTPTADIERVVQCLSLGLTFNQSRTCIAPRRVFVHQSVSDILSTKLKSHMANVQYEPSVRNATTEKAATLVLSAVDDGAQLLADGIRHKDGVSFVSAPTIVTQACPSMTLLRSDVFAPVVSFIKCESAEQAIEMDSECRYALGATIFGSDESEIELLASRVNAGCVVVNDMIVPTADPRVAFGGRGESGFGVTRGAAGLLEMTQLKTVIRQKGRWLPHLDAPTPHDADVLVHLIQSLHQSAFMHRAKAALSLTRVMLKQRRFRRQQPEK